MLHSIFSCLYDNDIISDDAFFRWEKSDEGEGKGVATTSVTKFFTYLREPDDDDE
jgi:translation initiation factor 4G